MKRWNSALGIAAVVALLISFLISALLLPVSTTWATTFLEIVHPVQPQVCCAPPGIQTFDIFHTETSTFNYQGGYVILSTSTDGTGGITYDDALWLTITHSDNTQSFAHFNFYTNPYPPADVTALFEPGNNIVFAQLIDLMGPDRGSYLSFYLVTSATPPPPSVMRIESIPFGTQFNAPFPFGRTSKDPVQTFTGSYTYAHTDLAISGRGPAPLFARSYNSNDTRVSPLGPGWTHNYNIHLASPITNSLDIVLDGPQGRSDLYAHNGDGSYSAPPAVYTTLVKNADGAYTATHQDQTKWIFDSVGKLIRIEDRYGNLSLLNYNSNGQLISVSDPAGRGSLTLTYYADGRLENVRDWLNPPRTVHFAYDSQDGQGRLSTVTDRENNTTTYTYDGASQRLATVTDANGHVAVTNTYDSQGRVFTQKDALGLLTGQQTTFNYNTNPDGTKTTIVTYPTTSYEPSWHHVEEDTYDSQGRIIKHVSKPTSNSVEWVTEQYTYDTSSNRDSVQDGRGNTTRFCYDIDYSGATIPGSHGNLTRSIEPAPLTAPGLNPLVSLFQYDTKNNLIETTPPKGVNNGATVGCGTSLLGSINPLYATNMAYDPTTQSKLLSTTHMYTDPELGQQTAITKYEYNDANNPGLVTTMIPPRGNTNPTPDYSFATSYTYFQPGGSTTSKAGMLERETKPLGIVTTYDYDAVGRQTSLVDPNGNAVGGVPTDHRWENVYDNEDRLRFVKAPAPLSGGAQLVTESRYDGVGNRTIGIDANGQVTKYSFDERDSLKEVRESPSIWTDPNAPPTDVILTEYQYDHLGNLSRVTRAKGDPSNERVVDYLYDGLNSQRKETQYPNWPSMVAPLVTDYTYDLNSNRHSMIDPLRKTTTFGYDTLNRMTSIIYSDGATPNVTYAYDPNGNRTSMVDGTGTTSYTYDEVDRMLSIASPGDSGPNSPNMVGYRYDLDGDRTKLIYPSGNAVTYHFDNAGRLESLTDWASRTTSYIYYPDGNLKTTTNVNTTSAQYAYDNAQRLKDVWNEEGANTISRHTYTRDAVGNATQLDEVLPQNGTPRPPNPQRQSVTGYVYDRLYRLTNENGPGSGNSTSYGYDPVGNRLSMVQGRTTVLYAYDRADRILNAGRVIYTVNANGNLIARGHETYQYDQANRMTRSRMPQPSQYVYNGDGLRVKTDTGQGPLDTHLYDVNRALSVLLNDGQRNYVWGAGPGPAYATDGNGGLEVYHTDGLDSTRAVTYMNGNVVQNYQTDAFGVPVKTQGSHNQPIQFTGEQRDKETGFYYLRARYYDTSIGRFTARDPFAGLVVDPRTLNQFIYAEDDPATNTDPSGLATLGVCLNGSLGLGVYGTASVCIVGTSNWEIGLQASAGGGGTTGFVGGLNVGAQYTTGNQIADLRGWDVHGGGSVAAGGGVGVEGSVGTGINGQHIFGASGQVGIGLDISPAPLLFWEIHGGTTYSWANGINVRDLFRQTIMWRAPVSPSRRIKK